MFFASRSVRRSSAEATLAYSRFCLKFNESTTMTKAIDLNHETGEVELDWVEIAKLGAAWAFGAKDSALATACHVLMVARAQIENRLAAVPQGHATSFSDAPELKAADADSWRVPALDQLSEALNEIRQDKDTCGVSIVLMKKHPLGIESNTSWSVNDAVTPDVLRNALSAAGDAVKDVALGNVPPGPKVENPPLLN